MSKTNRPSAPMRKGPMGGHRGPGRPVEKAKNFKGTMIEALSQIFALLDALVKIVEVLTLIHIICQFVQSRICIGLSGRLRYCSERTAILITGTAAAKMPPPKNASKNPVRFIFLHSKETLIAPHLFVRCQHLSRQGMYPPNYP